MAGTREVAALRRALDTERFTAKSANDRCAQLQKALDSERSTVRALRREILAQAKAAREEEAKKYAFIIDELKHRMALGQSEAIEASKEEISRTLAADFQRTMRARHEEWRRETKKQIDALKEQVREAQRVHGTDPDKNEKDALIRSIQAEFQKTLHNKQEEWKRETAIMMNALSSQLKDTQRLYDEARIRLTVLSNDTDQTHKLRQEIQTLKERNRTFEDRIQVLMESERRKTDEFRSQHDEYERRLLDLQKAAKKETHQILEEMKSKDRIITNLGKELHQVMTRLDTQQNEVTRSRVNLELSCRCRTDSERTEESSRIGAMKRLKTTDNETLSLINEETKLPDKTINKTDNEDARDIKKLDECVYTACLTKEVGLEMLYNVLSEEHQKLKRAYVDLLNRLQETPQSEPLLEEQFELDCVNTGTADAMAEKVRSLQQRLTELEMETRELREHNDLLEFRLMELDDGVGSNCSSHLHFNKSPLSRSPDTREIIDSDDISDSGVMSLSASEDISEADLQDTKLEPSNRDIKSRLMQMCQSVENVADRMCLQQTLSLLRHYESKLESLESTLAAAMCHEPATGRQKDILMKKTKLLDDTTKSPCRIVATVLPFTDLSPSYSKQLKEDFSLKKFLRDADGLQESGIFDEAGDNTDMICTQSTQTEWSFDELDSSPGDLGAEIKKLTQIRERIEEQNGNKKLLRLPSDESLIQDPLKEIKFYKERLDILEDKIAVYESNGNEQTKILSSRLEREVLLRAEVKHLKVTVQKLLEENRRLEEEKCEFEEAENDTRLRCQKLEVKLSALGEKKSDLQVQLQQNARTMANLRSSLGEEERKRNEARQQAASLETLVNQYEQRNFELEEKILEVSFNLQTLENVLIALIVWYIWHIMNVVKPYFLNSLVIKYSELGTEPTLQHALCRETCKNKAPEDCFCERQKTSTYENFYSDFNELKESKYRKGNSIDCSCKQNFNLSITTDKIISDLRNKCYRLDNRLKELEEKERKYNITLQKSDEVWETMENNLKIQLKETEEELLRKQIELDKKDTKIKKLIGNNEIELHLNERLLHLEEEVCKLHELLNQKEKEKKTLLESQQRMFQELETYTEKLHNFKTCVEIPLREELELQNKKYKEIQIELEIQEKEKNTDDELHLTEMNKLKQCLRKSNKDLEENEVTISELKEEVQTLEMALTELRNTLNAEREQNERLKIEVGAELEAKDLEIKMLRERSVVNQTLDVEMAECLRNCEGPRNHLYMANKKRSHSSKHVMHTLKRRPEAGFQVELDSTMDDAASIIPSTHETILNQIPKTIQQQKSDNSVSVSTNKSTNLTQKVIM